MDSRVVLRLFKGFGASLYGQAVVVVIQLAGVPILLSQWHAVLYGEWLILFAIPAYLSLGDLGFSLSAANDMTARVGRQDRAGALTVFQSLTDPSRPEHRAFPTALDPFLCSRYEIAAFGKEALALDVRYLGVCCGAGPHHIRSLAEALDRRPPASRFSPDMSKHILFGTDKRLWQRNLEYGRRTYGAARPASR